MLFIKTTSKNFVDLKTKRNAKKLLVFEKNDCLQTHILKNLIIFLELTIKLTTEYLICKSNDNSSQKVLTFCAFFPKICVLITLRKTLDKLDNLDICFCMNLTSAVKHLFPKGKLGIRLPKILTFFKFF